MKGKSRCRILHFGVPISEFYSPGEVPTYSSGLPLFQKKAAAPMWDGREYTRKLLKRHFSLESREYLGLLGLYPFLLR